MVDKVLTNKLKKGADQSCLKASNTFTEGMQILDPFLVAVDSILRSNKGAHFV